MKEKQEQAIKDEEKKRNDYKAGRQVGISGREMFYFNPDLAAGDGKFSLQFINKKKSQLKNFKNL